MEIEEALKIIKQSLKSEIIQSKHFKDQCIDRNLIIDEINQIVINNRILGITEQGFNLYKIWFQYTKSKDLNIIVRILNTGKIKLITIFPCYSARRIRK